MSMPSWIQRPATAVLQAVIVIVVAVATVAASVAVLLGPEVTP